MQKNGKCRAVIGNCPGYSSCVFYKPNWKYEKDLHTVYVKLSELSAERQRIIAAQYYGGKMLWEELTE